MYRLTKLKLEEKRNAFDTKRLELEEMEVEVEILKYELLLAQVFGGPPGGRDGP